MNDEPIEKVGNSNSVNNSVSETVSISENKEPKNSDSEINNIVSDQLFKHLINGVTSNDKKRKQADTTDPENMRNYKKMTTMNTQPKANAATQNAKRSATPTVTPTPIRNTFEVLTEADDHSDTDTEQEPSQTREKPPTPIIITGKTQNHKQLVQNIKKIAKSDFHIKYTANNVNLYFKKQEDKKKFLEIANKERLEYHTYTDSNDKTHAFVIRGLATEPTPEEIKNEIAKEYKISVIKAFRLNATKRPLYMITFKADIKLPYLQSKVRYINYTKIEWERYRNKKVIIQCHRCQQWGHATSNCQRAPKCLKCANNHLTRDCKTNAIKIKCANCAQEHTANSVQCPEYKKR